MVLEIKNASLVFCQYLEWVILSPRWKIAKCRYNEVAISFCWILASLTYIFPTLHNFDLNLEKADAFTSDFLFLGILYIL